ncbi:MAG TPA: alanine racemase [Nocardioides sp.]|uniref:alanine racemase n=1 Tax=Nocardioides sp. TaxID=35761 RepID=UPI002BA923E1|nr:alanine racemase [Nocardioides sp.]HQR27864.1 alanine racemase [Nocardioides sp.]
MSLTLTVDGGRWRRHLRGYAEATPGLVPVAKGNGYGFTVGRLARRTRWLAGRVPGSALDTLAVGAYEELPEAATRFPGSLLVLTPWRPFGAGLALPPALSRRVVHTVSRVSDLEALLARDPHARVVLELLTSMLRHGMSPAELREAGRVLSAHRGARLEGVAVHLPLTRRSHLPEMHRLMNDLVGADLGTTTVWVSHLNPDELGRLRAAYPDFTVRPRVGTALWLGDREALRVTAPVLDVHEVTMGQSFGYRGRPAPWRGHLVVVGAGTAHGIGLSAPTGDPSVRARFSAAARGGLDALGMSRSPFVVDGALRLFAEPPHMQCSMLLLPHRARVPAVGDEVEARVRFTTTTFDHIHTT